MMTAWLIWECQKTVKLYIFHLILTTLLLTTSFQVRIVKYVFIKEECCIITHFVFHLVIFYYMTLFLVVSSKVVRIYTCIYLTFVSLRPYYLLLHLKSLL
jgi:hypothetical protein